MFAIGALLVAGSMMATAAFLPWWSLTVSNNTTKTVLTFFPGSDYTISEQNGTNSVTYSYGYHYMLGPLANLYLWVMALSLTAAVLLFAAAGIALYAQRRRSGGWARGPVVALIALVVFLLPLGLVITVAAYQPGLYSDANPAGACSGTSEWYLEGPCYEFWGCPGNSTIAVSCGSSVGWILAAVSVPLAVAGGAAWWAALYDPWERDPNQAPTNPAGAGTAAAALGPRPPPQNPTPPPPPR
ncbi:MAG TPA: hypothetical protein VEH57_08865 [Thermoplasmata archaeon]|nr:hypothetical protein [Thermoplasmata archaeon]